MSRKIAEGVIEIDTKLGGWEHVTSAYLLTGDAPVLVEVGSRSSVVSVINELGELGIGANDLSAIALTHIHLDHAGGIGEISRAFPNAKIYVHEKGARHLVDPSRLNASAEMVYGSLLDSLYGRLDPTPKDRVFAVGDGNTIEVSANRHLEVIDSPGHAKHHLGFFDPTSGLVFTGDSVGVLLPEIKQLRPATPPSDFDLNLALSSIAKFKTRNPVGLAFAHYGLYESANELLDEASDTLRSWAEVAERAYVNGIDIAEELIQNFGESIEGASETAIERLGILNGIHSNAAGLKMWLERGQSTHHH